MTGWILLAVTIVVMTVVGAKLWRRGKVAAQLEHIRSFQFPRGLFQKAAAHRPELSMRDWQLVSRGLRQFFLAYHRSGFQFVSMPSQIADELWHEFILYTADYQRFCERAFGRFLHHTPAVLLGDGKADDAGLRRTWFFACQEENINPHRPSRLPLLFALDKKFGIKDGFHYEADCRLRREQGDDSVHCGTSFAGCGGGTGHVGSSSATSDAGPTRTDPDTHAPLGEGAPASSSFDGDASGASGSSCGGSSCGGGGCGGGGD